MVEEAFQMKNMGILLDDKTIINFTFFGKLLKRYYIITMLSPLLVLLVGFYVYNSQNDVYMISAGMLVKSSESSEKSSIASLLGSEKQEFSIAEVLSLGKSIDFQQKIAKQLVDHPDFSKMNFNTIKVKKMKSHSEIFGNCAGNNKCVYSILRGAVGSYYDIKRSAVIVNKYIVSIKTLDGFTSREILKLITKEITKSRKETLLSSLTDQMEVSKKLIKKKKEELVDVNIVSLEDLLKTKTKELSDLATVIRSYKSIFMSQKLQLSKAKLTVKETKRAISQDTNGTDKIKYTKSLELKKDIEKLREDIRVLQGAAVNGSEQDQLIISQVQNQLAVKERAFKKLGKIKRKFSNIEKFKDTKDKSSDYNEFDYNVLVGQHEATKKELVKLDSRKLKLEAERLFYENKLKSLKPSFDYLKLLKDKMIQLELVKWTVGNDIIFDKLPESVRRFKRTSLSKIVLFSFMISLFIVFLGVFVRYMFDKRIYDEYELSRNFKGLEIIGNTPEFD
jgi:hypothetical protein